MTRPCLHTIVLSLGLLALLSACGGTPAAEPASAPPISAPAAPASAPGSPSAKPSAVASAPASVASAASAPAAASAKPSAAASPKPAAAGSAAKLTIDPDANSQVDIVVKEILAGATIKTDAVESSKTVSGSISVDGSGAIAPSSKLSLDLRTIKSDRGIRDEFIKNRFVLNTGQFPNAEFVPKEIQGLSGGLPTSGDASFKLLGDATVHGVTKPMTWDVKATFDAQTVKGEATTDFKFADFSITVPRVPSVAELEDGGKLTVKFQATRSSS